MSRFVATIDPPAAIAGRTELNLNAGDIAVSKEGIDWGEATVQAYMAEQRWGQTVTDYRVPNRVVTIPLGLGMNESGETESEARIKLQQKVGLLQRQGGVLKRQRQGGEVLYADIVNASIVIPDVTGDTSASVEDKVILKLECLPDFYGDEIELDAQEEVAQVIGVVKKGGSTAAIKGDYPGRCRVVLTDTSGNIQRSALWAFRSLYYSAAAEAALFFDAYNLTAVNGAVSGTEAEAISGKAVTLASPQANLWHPFLELRTAAGKHLTHLGTYRILARVKGATSAKFRLSWANGEGTATTLNPAQAISSEGFYEIVDLGEVRLEEPPSGEAFWSAVLQVETGATSVSTTVDRVWLQPLDDGAGRLLAVAEPELTALAPSAEPTVGESNNTIHAGAAWSNPTFITPGHSGQYASVAAISQALVGKTFGFGIPTGATIQKIVAEVDAENLYSKAAKLNLQYVKGGAGSGSTKGIVLGSGERKTYTQTMPGGLTRAEVNEASFGLGLWTSKETGGQEVRIYSVKLVVTYSFGTVGTAEDAIIYANKKAEVRTDGSYREASASSALSRISGELGDLARIPPSGIENRPVQLFVKQSREQLPKGSGGETVPGTADVGTDKLKAQIFYRPCWIGRV